MAETMESRLVVHALHLSLGHRRPEAVVLGHSDQNSQYASDHWSSSDKTVEAGPGPWVAEQAKEMAGFNVQLAVEAA